MKTKTNIVLIVSFIFLSMNLNAVGKGGSNILLVVGDENGTSVPGKGTGDVFIINRLETALGHKVTLGLDDAPADKLRRAAREADLVIVAESVTSRKLLDKLKPVETPIINYEAHIQDDMGLTALEPGGDPGEPPECAYGVRDKEMRITIVTPSHPLAAGTMDNVTVYREPKQVTWGTVGKSAEVVAILPGEKTGATIYVYRKGSELFDGTVAAGLRVGFFLEDDDETGTANLMTDEGLRLFDAAVKFALETDSVH